MAGGWRAGVAGLVACTAWVGGGGCSTDIAVLDVRPADAGSMPSFDGSVGSRQEFCAGSGPPPLVDSSPGGASMCASAFAKSAFANALCSCGDVTSTSAISTDVVAGAAGAASVGVNRNLHPGNLAVQGDLDVFGSGDLTGAGATVSVAGDLRAQGTVRDFASVTVGGDAWLTGGISTAGSLAVTGALQVPPGEPVMVGGREVYGSLDHQSFSGGPPCDCSGDGFLSVAGVVATYAAQNDDGGMSTRLLDTVQAPFTRTFVCGRYYLDSISGTAPIHLTAMGRVAFFVAGDLSTSDFVVDTPSGAEVDLFVAGGLTVSGVFQLGDAAHPGSSRVYVGKAVDFEGTASFGYLYAPVGNVTIGSQQATAYGAVFANSLNAGADLTVHYDPALLSASCP